MQHTTSINIRVPLAIKTKAQKVAQKNGISLTAAIRFFLDDLSKDQYIARLVHKNEGDVFHVHDDGTTYKYPDKLVDSILKDVAAEKKAFKEGRSKTYKTADELFRALSRKK